jgi:hypothetical protein
MFVIVHLQTMFHTQIVGMFIIYLCKKIHIPSSNDPLVIAVKLKDKENVHMSVTPLFYILQNNYLNKKLQRSIASVTPTSQIHASTIL